MVFPFSALFSNFDLIENNFSQIKEKSRCLVRGEGAACARRPRRSRTSSTAAPCPRAGRQELEERPLRRKTRPQVPRAGTSGLQAPTYMPEGSAKRALPSVRGPIDASYQKYYQHVPSQPPRCPRLFAVPWPAVPAASQASQECP